MPSTVSPARLWATLQVFSPGTLPSTGTAGGTEDGDWSVKPLHPAAQGKEAMAESPGLGGGGRAGRAAGLRPQACRVRGQLSQHQGQSLFETLLLASSLGHLGRLEQHSPNPKTTSQKITFLLDLVV